MMRKVSFTLILCFTLSFLTACLPANDATTVVVIDSAKILQESAVGKNALGTIEGIQKKMQDEINTLQLEVQKNPEDMYAQQLLQTVYMQFQQRMSAEQQNIGSVFDEVLRTTLDEYRKTKGVKVILASDGVLSYDAAIDVSADIIKLLDSKAITFKEVATETPAELVKQIMDSMPRPPAEEEAAPAEDAKEEDAAPQE